jgi:hypothetical protein
MWKKLWKLFFGKPLPKPTFTQFNEVMWADDVSPAWRYIHTNLYMGVIDWYYHEGSDIVTPGYIYKVEYQPDSKYYDPDYRNSKPFRTMEIHECNLRASTFPVERPPSNKIENFDTAGGLRRTWVDGNLWIAVDRNPEIEERYEYIDRRWHWRGLFKKEPLCG